MILQLLAYTTGNNYSLSHVYDVMCMRCVYDNVFQLAEAEPRALSLDPAEQVRIVTQAVEKVKRHHSMPAHHIKPVSPRKHSTS